MFFIKNIKTLRKRQQILINSNEPSYRLLPWHKNLKLWVITVYTKAATGGVL